MSKHLVPPRAAEQVNRTKGRVQDLERRLQKREGRNYLESVPSLYLQRALSAGKQDLPSNDAETQTPISFTRMVATAGFDAATWSLSDPTKLWIRTPGLFLCTYVLSWDASAAGGRYAELTEFDSGGSAVEVVTASGMTPASATDGRDFHASGSMVMPLLVAGHYLELRSWQNSGGTLTTGESPMPKIGLALLSTDLTSG